MFQSPLAVLFGIALVFLTIKMIKSEDPMVIVLGYILCLGGLITWAYALSQVVFHLNLEAVTSVLASVAVLAYFSREIPYIRNVWYGGKCYMHLEGFKSGENKYVLYATEICSRKECLRPICDDHWRLDPKDRTKKICMNCACASE